MGALIAGLLADAFGISVAIVKIGALTLVSGLIVAGVMKETLLAGQRMIAKERKEQGQSVIEPTN